MNVHDAIIYHMYQVGQFIVCALMMLSIVIISVSVPDIGKTAAYFFIGLVMVVFSLYNWLMIRQMQQLTKPADTDNDE